jgi:hypothetical protein
MPVEFPAEASQEYVAELELVRMRCREKIDTELPRAEQRGTVVAGVD